LRATTRSYNVVVILVESEAAAAVAVGSGARAGMLSSPFTTYSVWNGLS
jgi:hypothetical protein